MKKKTLYAGIIVIFIITNYCDAQIYNVFQRASNTAPIYQINAGLFGVGFLNSTGINSQLSISTTLPNTSLVSLCRNSNYFYFDFDGLYGKLGKTPSSPALVINNTNGNLIVGNGSYTFPARLNIALNFSDATQKISVYNTINTYTINDDSYGYKSEIYGPGADVSNAIHISNFTYAGEKRVFVVKGDGSTEIGGKHYIGQYGNAKLSVNGLIAAKEVVVNTQNWSDFVFDKQYNIMALDDLQNYIQYNKHLPDVPSCAEVIKNGYSIGEMDKILLQKIEELTIYILKLNNEIDSLKAERSK